jgi:hypothetical protein
MKKTPLQVYVSASSKWHLIRNGRIPKMFRNGRAKVIVNGCHLDFGFLPSSGPFQSQRLEGSTMTSFDHPVSIDLKSITAISVFDESDTPEGIMEMLERREKLEIADRKKMDKLRESLGKIVAMPLKRERRTMIRKDLPINEELVKAMKRVFK